MSYLVQNEFSNNSGAGEAEETLRLIARLPAPVGLEDRVHAGLRSAPRSARVLAWPAAFSPAGGWLRAAAAAAIVFVVGVVEADCFTETGMSSNSSSWNCGIVFPFVSRIASV